MPRKLLLGNWWVLLWLCHWESTAGSLFQQFTSSAACHWDHDPGICLEAHSSTLWPQKVTSRELCCGKESSIPHRYFLSQIHPFRMNWCTSYVLQENKLDPVSRMNGYEHYSCRNLPGHPGHPCVFSFPFCTLRELGAAKKAFGYLFQGWSWAFGFLGTMCSAVGPWWPNLLNLTACQYLNLVVFKEAVQAFLHAVCLNLGLRPESINPINVQEWEGWKCLICASCWHHLILSFWNEPIYDWMLQCKFCK